MGNNLRGKGNNNQSRMSSLKSWNENQQGSQMGSDLKKIVSAKNEKMKKEMVGLQSIVAELIEKEKKKGEQARQKREWSVGSGDKVRVSE